MHFEIPWFFLRLAAVDLDEEGFLRMQSTAEITKKTKTRAPPTANNIARIGVTLNRECPFPTLPPPSRVNALPPDSSKWSGTFVVKAFSRTGTLRPDTIEINEFNKVICVLFSAKTKIRQKIPLGMLSYLLSWMSQLLWCIQFREPSQ